MIIQLALVLGADPLLQGILIVDVGKGRWRGSGLVDGCCACVAHRLAFLNVLWLPRVQVDRFDQCHVHSDAPVDPCAPNAQKDPQCH